MCPILGPSEEPSRVFINFATWILEVKRVTRDQEYETESKIGKGVDGCSETLLRGTDYSYSDTSLALFGISTYWGHSA